MNKYKYKKVKYYSSEYDEIRTAYLIGAAEGESGVYFAFDPGLEESGHCGCLICIEKNQDEYQDSENHSGLYFNDVDGKLAKIFDLPPETPPEPKEKEAVELLKKLGYKVSK